MIPYNIEIFSLALGLGSPWFIEDIKFVSVNNSPFKELHININFHKGHRFPLEDGSSVTAYDTLPKRWRHSNFFQHKCYLHCRVPRLKGTDGKVRLLSVPWARPGSGLTLLFEAFSMILVESEMPINKVAECVQETPPRIMRIVNHWVEEALEDVDLSEVRSIEIDETSSKKGHNYVTVVADISERKIIDVQVGKDSQTIERFAAELESKGGNRNQIEKVCIDMSQAYISGIERTFPNANIVFDKFHIIQHLNKAMNTVRKDERHGNDALKGHKYTFLKSNKNLSDSKRAEIAELSYLYPKLGEAYRLKEMFFLISRTLCVRGTT